MPTKHRTVPPARRTVYKGITFRSRLESRWARVFDKLGWDWHYEPDCFADPESITKEYLPDFRIDRRGLRTYVEIKPPLTPGEYAEAIRKLELVWTEHPQATLWLLHLQAGGGFLVTSAVGWDDGTKEDWVTVEVDAYLATLLAAVEK